MAARGSPRPVRAVTFDFWGTLYADVPGASAERTRRRARLVAEAAAGSADGPALDVDLLERLLVELLPRAAQLRDASLRGFTMAERIGWALAEAGVRLGPGDLGPLARAAADLGSAFPPRPVDGAREVVARVAAAAKVGLVSDTGIIDGRTLRRVMESDGLAAHFGALGFSDETGRSKPHADAFRPVLERLAVPPEEAVHVGDLAETDVAGALSLGMRAVWIEDGRETDSPPSDPRVVRVRSLSEVPAALERLSLP